MHARMVMSLRKFRRGQAYGNAYRYEYTEMPTEKGIRICRQAWAYASADRHGYTYMPQVWANVCARMRDDIIAAACGPVRFCGAYQYQLNSYLPSSSVFIASISSGLSFSSRLSMFLIICSGLSVLGMTAIP